LPGRTVLIHSSHEMHSSGQESIASSIHSSLPPSGRTTCAFSASSSISKTSGQSSAQVPQPTQHSSSTITLRPIPFSFIFVTQTHNNGHAQKAHLIILYPNQNPQGKSR